LFAKKDQITFCAAAEVISNRLYHFLWESRELFANAGHVLQYRKSKVADISNSCDHPRFLNRAVRTVYIHITTRPIQSRATVALILQQKAFQNVKITSPKYEKN
jgi:hypothetical protein